MSLLSCLLYLKLFNLHKVIKDLKLFKHFLFSLIENIKCGCNEEVWENHGDFAQKITY